MAVLLVLQPYLTLLGAIASFLVILRMFWIRLARRYAAFVGFLAVHGTLLVLLSTIRPNTTWHGYVYLFGQAFLWLFYVLVILELYRKVLAMYAAISNLASYVVVISMGVSIAISFATISNDLSRGAHQSGVILRHMAIQRAVTAAMCLHLIVLTWFLSWMLVRLPRNTVYHTVLFFFYFLAEAVGNLYRNLTGMDVTEGVNVGLQICTLLAFAGWLVLMRPVGEDLPSRPKSGGTGVDSSKILRQMEQVNRALSKGTEE